MKKRVLSLMMALLLLWQLIPSVCLAAGGTADSSFVCRHGRKGTHRARCRVLHRQRDFGPSTEEK